MKTKLFHLNILISDKNHTIIPVHASSPKCSLFKESKQTSLIIRNFKETDTK